MISKQGQGKVNHNALTSYILSWSHFSNIYICCRMCNLPIEDRLACSACWLHLTPSITTYWSVIYSSPSESRGCLFRGSNPFYVTGCSQSASMGCSWLVCYRPVASRKEACLVLSSSLSTVLTSSQLPNDMDSMCTHTPIKLSCISTQTLRQWTVKCISWSHVWVISAVGCVPTGCN